MKKQYLILTAVTVLALAAMSCGIQFVGSNPTPVPQQPIPQNFNPGPQGPQNNNPGPQEPGPNPGDPVNPGPQGPGPGNVNPGNPGPVGPGPQNPGPGGPGEIQITFTADRTTLSKGQCAQLQWVVQGGFGVNLNGQQVEHSSQQQVCPTVNTTYRLEVDAGDQMLVREINIAVSGGSQQQNIVTITPTKKKSGGGNTGPTNTPSVTVVITPIPAQISTYDIGLINMFTTKNGNIWVTVKNTGNQPWTNSYTLSCIGDWRTCDVCNYASSSKTENITLAVGDIYNTTTGLSLNSNITHQKVTCTLATNDSNSSNNSIGPTSVK